MEKRILMIVDRNKNRVIGKVSINKKFDIEIYLIENNLKEETPLWFEIEEEERAIKLVKYLNEEFEVNLEVISRMYEFDYKKCFVIREKKEAIILFAEELGEYMFNHREIHIAGCFTSLEEAEKFKYSFLKTIE